MNIRLRKAFTLIEMLIVIVIIGILAAALIPRLTSVQGRARDTKRKVDLRTIANANEIYLLDNNTYAQAKNVYYTGPLNTSAGVFSTSGASSPWITSLTGILTNIPIDPLNVAGTYGHRSTGDYLYYYGAVYNNPINAYELSSILENSSDPDRCGIKNYQYYEGIYSGSWCGSYSKMLYIVGPGYVTP